VSVGKLAPFFILAALKKLGFAVMTLANNHTLDYGILALKDTQMC